MAAAPLVACLSCLTSVTPEESAVFRNGVKIAHVRCWTLKDRATPMRHADQDAQPNALTSGLGASGGAAR